MFQTCSLCFQLFQHSVGAFQNIAKRRQRITITSLNITSPPHRQTISTITAPPHGPGSDCRSPYRKPPGTTGSYQKTARKLPLAHLKVNRRPPVAGSLGWGRDGVTPRVVPRQCDGKVAEREHEGANLYQMMAKPCPSQRPQKPTHD